jgi:methylenetetrahydrofolate reductase (NADPH)
MRDEAKYLDGREIKNPPSFFIGAAASPFASEPKFMALRDEKKVNAGAQFFQTNLVFNTDKLEEWLNEIAKRNILNKVYILAGISPLKSLKMAHFLNNSVPGVFIPEGIMKRMEFAKEKGNEAEEGIQIALELIDKIKGKQGINGFHIMTLRWEEIIPRLITEAGLLPKSMQTKPTAAPELVN